MLRGSRTAELGGIAIPCHPGRPTVGLCEHYEKRAALENVVAVELLNGGSKKGENERAANLVAQYGYRSTGGSDSHLVSLIGLCATRFDADVRGMDDLVRELKTGNYEAVDFRPKPKAVPKAVPVDETPS